ncbi:MAG: hypothetical protein AVO39_10455 [delta proteobacterium MLS_D]|jgi:hypothetical protein|nr:MAG: hypothetical protein AVO39_10455 [delta proteobacterium MLS_D]
MKITSFPLPTQAMRQVGSPKPEPGPRQAETSGAGTPIDKVIRRAVPFETPTYERAAASRDEATVARLMQEAEAVHQKLCDLVTTLIRKQGISLNRLARLAGQGETDRAPRVELEALLGRHGELGVEAVSDRIIAFARALSGGDPSRITELREAIIQGFREAEAMLGYLPDISRHTHDRVMEKLDVWLAET